MGYSADDVLQFLGNGGLVSSGTDCFTYIQSNTDTHSINTDGSSETDSVNESGNDSFSQTMAGTETYGTSGTISSGSDSFTWAQSATDALTMIEHGGGTTVGGTPNYILTLIDQIFNSFSDVGTDILGASDSIVGGCDTYIETGSRNVTSSLTDYGTTASPIYAEAGGSDDYNSSDTGSSTLTTNGSVYSVDTFDYSENSGNTATDSVSTSSGSGSQINMGSASDGYNDNDTGTMTRSNTTTTSYDSFTLGDSHWLSGSIETVSTDSTSSLSYNDAATDSDSVSAGGDYSTSAGSSYSFLDTETSNDVFSLTDNIYGQWNGTFNLGSNETQSMAGYTSPSSYSYTQSSDYEDTNSEGGMNTVTTVTSPFSESGSASGTFDYGISGPPAATVTLENTNTYTATTSGSPPGAPIQVLLAGNAVSAGETVADDIGTFAANGAVHDGTTQPVLDQSQGLISALGGQLMHPLEFKGSEITPTQSGSGILLDEPNESNPEFGTTSWISHPSNLGYLRPSPGSSSIGGSLGGSSGGSTSGSAGISPSQDSGTSNGSTQDELRRLASYNGGAAMNPTSTQGTTSSRAQQRGVGRAGDDTPTPPNRIGDPYDMMSGDGAWGNRPFAAGINPYAGHGTYNPFSGWGGSGGSSTVPSPDSGTTGEGGGFSTQGGFGGSVAGSSGVVSGSLGGPQPSARPSPNGYPDPIVLPEGQHIPPEFQQQDVNAPPERPPGPNDSLGNGLGALAPQSQSQSAPQTAPGSLPPEVLVALLTVAIGEPFAEDEPVSSKDLINQLYIGGYLPNLQPNIQVIGAKMEVAGLKLLGLAKYTGTPFFHSLKRTTITKSVSPDAIGTLTHTDFQRVQGLFGPYIRRVVKSYPASIFYDMKASSGTINLSSTKNEAAGYIDVLSRSKAAKAGLAPVLMYITTSDTKIGNDIIKLATQNNILVAQRILTYNKSIGGYFLSPAEPLNLIVVETQMTKNLGKFTTADIITGSNYKTFAQSMTDLFGP